MNPTESNGQKIIVIWLTKDSEAISRVRQRFNLPLYTTLNGCTPGLLRQEDRALLEETARRGFLSFRPAEWTFNGLSYSW